MNENLAFLPDYRISKSSPSSFNLKPLTDHLNDELVFRGI